MIRRPPRFTLFPYTTLCRSRTGRGRPARRPGRGRRRRRWRPDRRRLLRGPARLRRGGPFQDPPTGHPSGPPHFPARRTAMATGETGFEDVTYDLISVQYHSLKAGHDYGQYVRDAENAGLQDIAAFFREVMEQDSARARRCHEFLRQISGTEQGGPATQ